MSKRADASRANGAKSTGPRTPESRAKSAANSTRHGLLSSQRLLLPFEDPAALQELSDQMQCYYMPSNRVECELFTDLVAARWRIIRCRAFESIILSGAAAPAVMEIMHPPGSSSPIVDAVRNFQRAVGDSQALDLLARYETRLTRIFERTDRVFRRLRECPLTPPPPEFFPPKPEAEFAMDFQPEAEPAPKPKSTPPQPRPEPKHENYQSKWDGRDGPPPEMKMGSTIHGGTGEGG